LGSTAGFEHTAPSSAVAVSFAATSLPATSTARSAPVTPGSASAKASASRLPFRTAWSRSSDSKAAAVRTSHSVAQPGSSSPRRATSTAATAVWLTGSRIAIAAQFH
jgi:hypothetical protein